MINYRETGIIKKAVVILGANGGISSSSGRISKAEELCEEFVNTAIEDTVLTVKWSFALKRVDNIEAHEITGNNFTEVANINDCIKCAVIVPSNLQFYTEAGKIYFKGGKLTSLFYYSKRIIDNLLNNDTTTWQQVPSGFKLLAALSLAWQVSFAMYSDSLFTDGLKKQYLIKLDETTRIYSVDYNLINSGEI
ncbi:hypothetical protein [Rickettsia endosymbiont of Oedothorax gibbosus]|uniref:hypothetical protein n=1 Tax=Rickettsia endosymbiont of Oedothorax gibbosus TaxID=931099 RepID=UPI002024EE7D|nr:hypothetical protein [Rickettsia endosymbiont of Oedothorax gibbosus]